MATANETVGGSVFITVSCGGTIGGDRCPSKDLLRLKFGALFLSMGRKQGVFSRLWRLAQSRDCGNRNQVAQTLLLQTISFLYFFPFLFPLAKFC